MRGTFADPGPPMSEVWSSGPPAPLPSGLAEFTHPRNSLLCLLVWFVFQLSESWV